MRACSPERTAVRGQHQRVLGQVGVAVQRTQVQRQRIGVGLVVEHADVGGNARQHHVAGDQHAQVGRVQRGMLGRMTVAHDDAPVAAADTDLITVQDARVARRHGRHQAGIVIGALADLFLRGRVDQSVAREMVHRRLAAGAHAVAAPARGPERSHHEIRHGHPQLGVPALAQPVRQADVVGMHVRDQHAQHRQAVQFLLEHPLPQRLDLVAGDAAVDDGPALASVELVAQQPQVDMIQRERQRHADPLHAVGDRLGLAGFGLDIAPWVLQLVLVGIHCLALRA